MDFIDKIKQLASRIPQQLEYCKTEEATKNALIMPFINALGYDVFNPTEVVPEFTADIGTKKGEKVDYAIIMNSVPIILFECKWAGADLAKEHASQLYRYFTAVPEVRFGVLTNGVRYLFYSDLDAQNRMDERPFFEFNMLSFHERDILELKKFTKSAFNLGEIITTANDLKYTAAIKQIVAQEFDSPSEEFVVYLVKQVYQGRMTQGVKEQFAVITQKALRLYLNDQINNRFKQVITEEDPLRNQVEQKTEPVDEAADSEAENRQPAIHTTEEEIESYFVVKSILREAVDLKRVHMRDTKSYCGILLDNNNRKPIIRLHFNRKQKYIGIFEDGKSEQRIAIDEIDDIYKYAAKIIAAAKVYG
jgi:predicted type IV restriction endonuclease